MVEVGEMAKCPMSWCEKAHKNLFEHYADEPSLKRIIFKNIAMKRKETKVKGIMKRKETTMRGQRTKKGGSK